MVRRSRIGDRGGNGVRVESLEPRALLSADAVVTDDGPEGQLATAEATFAAGLEPSPPTIDVTVSSIVAEDTAFPLIATLAHPQAIVISQLTVKWGDGHVDSVTSPAAVERLTHVYAKPGVYAITSVVRDINGMETARRLMIDVAGRRPRPTVVARTVARPGRPLVLKLKPDPLADRPVQFWTIDWGDGTIQDVNGTVKAVAHPYARTGRYRISVSATDGQAAYRASPHGKSRSAGLVVAVNNRAPRPSFAAPSSAVPGQKIRFAGKTNDGAARGYAIAWDFGDSGKARPAFVPVTQAAMNPDHTYARRGVYTVRMWTRNPAGSIGVAITRVRVAPVVIQTRPDRTGERAVVVGGTAGNDAIRFLYRWSGVEVTFNGRSLGIFNVDRLIAFGGAGDDVMTVDDLVGLPVELHGDAGNDRLHASSAEKILIGGEGVDSISDGSRQWLE